MDFLDGSKLIMPVGECGIFIITVLMVTAYFRDSPTEEENNATVSPRERSAVVDTHL
jgi:hypothetical protein